MKKATGSASQFSTDKAKTNHVKVLRQDFLAHLSHLDALASTYGQLGLFKQIMLYMLIFGISIASLILANPILFIIGTIALNVIIFMNLQYQALESRFLKLVHVLENVPKSIENLVAENLKLEAELIEKGNKFHSHLVELEQARQLALTIALELRENMQELDTLDTVKMSAVQEQQADDACLSSKTPEAEKLADKDRYLSLISKYSAWTFEDNSVDNEESELLSRLT